MKPLTTCEIVLNKLAKFKPVKIDATSVETTNPKAIVCFNEKGNDIRIYANKKEYEKRTMQEAYVCLKMLKIWVDKNKFKEKETPLLEIDEPLRPVFKPIEIQEKPAKKSGAIKHTEFYDQHKHSINGLEKAKKRNTRLKFQSFYMPEERLTVFNKEGKNEAVIKNRILTRKQD